MRPYANVIDRINNNTINSQLSSQQPTELRNNCSSVDSNNINDIETYFSVKIKKSFSAIGKDVTSSVSNSGCTLILNSATLCSIYRYT